MVAGRLVRRPCLCRSAAKGPRDRHRVRGKTRLGAGIASLLDKGYLAQRAALTGALSMTTSVEDAFGARQMVDGFVLSNQLTDFSFDARDANGPIANRVEAGKRPRSAMSPTLVSEKGTQNLVLATGSPGGSSIINYVAKVLVGTMDWGLNVQQAISLPNFGSRIGD